MIAPEIQALSDSTAALFRDAADVAARAQDVERSARLLLTEHDDLLARCRAQDTEIARLHQENATLHAAAAMPPTDAAPDLDTTCPHCGARWAEGITAKWCRCGPDGELR
jgi:hypothetical protein